MVFQLNPTLLYAARVFYGWKPRHGPKAVFVPLDFTSAATGSNGADIPLNLELVKDLDRLELIQSVFIDNTVSGQTFSLTALTTQHTISIQAGRQAFLPLFAADTVSFIASTGNNSPGPTPAQGLIKLQFNTFHVAPYVW